jgi:hypothetical protein
LFAAALCWDCDGRTHLRHVLPRDLHRRKHLTPLIERGDRCPCF